MSYMHWKVKGRLHLQTMMICVGQRRLPLNIFSLHEREKRYKIREITFKGRETKHKHTQKPNVSTNSRKNKELRSLEIPDLKQGSFSNHKPGVPSGAPLGLLILLKCPQVGARFINNL